MERKQKKKNKLRNIQWNEREIREIDGQIDRHREERRERGREKRERERERGTKENLQISEGHVHLMNGTSHDEMVICDREQIFQ